MSSRVVDLTSSQPTLPTVKKIRAKMKEAQTKYASIAYLMLRDNCSYDDAVRHLLDQPHPTLETDAYFGGPTHPSVHEAQIIICMDMWHLSREEVLLIIRAQIYPESLNIVDTQPITIDDKPFTARSKSRGRSRRHG